MGGSHWSGQKARHSCTDAGLEGLPLDSFDGLLDDGVLCRHQLGGFREGPTDGLELLRHEAMAANLSNQVAILYFLPNHFLL